MTARVAEMKKYNNWGIDMGGLSVTDPARYRKINYVLNDKGVHTDLLDVVETVPLEYVNEPVYEGPDAEAALVAKELKSAVAEALKTLTPREEWILRMRFGIDTNTDHTLETVGGEHKKLMGYSITRDRVRQIEAKAIRKLRHLSRSKKLNDFRNVA